MTTYQVLTQEVNTAIASMEFPQHPQGLYEPIAYTLSLGGKRIRPVFMLLAAQLFNGHIEDIMDAAVSLDGQCRLQTRQTHCTQTMEQQYSHSVW